MSKRIKKALFDIANPLAVIPGGQMIAVKQASMYVLTPDTGCPDCGKSLLLVRPKGFSDPYFRHRAGEKHD